MTTKTRIDPLTGLEIADVPFEPEFLVVTRDEFLPEANWSMGIGRAQATFPTRIQALEFIIASGCRRTLTIQEI